MFFPASEKIFYKHSFGGGAHKIQNIQFIFFLVASYVFFSFVVKVAIVVGGGGVYRFSFFVEFIIGRLYTMCTYIFSKIDIFFYFNHPFSHFIIFCRL